MNPHLTRRSGGISVLLAAMTLAACGSSPGATGSQSSPSTPASTSAATTACKKLQATLASAPATLGQLASQPANARAAVTAFITKLDQEAASGGPQLQTAARNFGNDVQKALTSIQSGQANVSTIIAKLTQDANSVSRACTGANGS